MNKPIMTSPTPAEIRELRRKVRNLESKLKRRDKKIEGLEGLIYNGVRRSVEDIRFRFQAVSTMLDMAEQFKVAKYDKQAIVDAITRQALAWSKGLSARRDVRHD